MGEYCDIWEYYDYGRLKTVLNKISQSEILGYMGILWLLKFKNWVKQNKWIWNIGILWFLKFKNQIKWDGLILAALTKQITIVAFKDWWPRACPHPSGAQLTKQGSFYHLWCDKKLLQTPIPKGLHNGNSSLLLNLVLPNCFVCFGPRLCIRNDKSASFKLGARQLQCQCQHDRVLVATRGSRKRGAGGTLHLMLGK